MSGRARGGASRRGRNNRRRLAMEPVEEMGVAVDGGGSSGRAAPSGPAAPSGRAAPSGPAAPSGRAAPSGPAAPSMRDIHDLPAGKGLETPLHPKKRRMWQPSMRAGTPPSPLISSSSVAPTLPLVAPPSPPKFSVPSPAMFLKCENEGWESPGPLLATPGSQLAAPGSQLVALGPLLAAPGPQPASPDPLPAFLDPPTPSTQQPSAPPRPLRRLSPSILNKENIEANFGSDEDSEESDNEDGMVFLGIPRAFRSTMQTPLDQDEDLESDPVAVSKPVADSETVALSAPDIPLTGTDQPWSPYEFEWKEFPVSQIQPELRRETFSQINVGPTTPLTDPYEIFTGIWDREIMEYIASETNRYAQEVAAQLVQNNCIHPDSRITRWFDTTSDELYVYFAIVLAMGVIVKSRVQEYWATSSDIFATPGFRAHMSIDRFFNISKCLHFNNNGGMCALELGSSEAKMYKIQPIVSHLNRKFQLMYTPAQNIALDESLLMWKGWLEMSQLIPNKAAKRGIKTYDICESQTGYLWRFEIHAHKKSTLQNEDPLAASTPSIVLRLIKGLENKGYTLWMDNFYNSPCLARRLKCMGFDCVGTLRTDRKFVPQDLHNLTKKNMNLGQVVGLTSGDVDIIVWRDYNRVAMISTYHGIHQQTLRGSTKPTLIYDYNIMMGGVDKKDQLLAMYPVERKRTRVWYKKLFRRLLNISVLNSYIIHRHTSQITHRNFRMHLIRSLLSKHSTTSSLPPALILSPNRRIDISHRIAEYPMNGRQRLRRACKACKKLVHTFCIGCRKTVCIDPCFVTIHK